MRVLTDWLKHGLRHWSRGRVICKRLPLDLGGRRLFCSPDALLSMWKPGWNAGNARSLFDWVRAYIRPGMKVWDIGANQGLFAFAAASRSGREGEVLAFEPDSFLVNLLERSRAMPDATAASVQILPVAVSDKCGIVSLLIAASDRTLNHLENAKGNPRTGGSRDKRLVVSVNLDLIMESHGTPDFVKIDVEGAEAAVLLGATELLRVGRPLMIIEVADETMDQVFAILAAADYRIFDAGAPEKGEVVSSVWNNLAVPAERVTEFLRSHVNRSA